MLTLDWDISYNLDISFMDQHHQHLIALLKKSYAAMQLNDKYQIKDVLNELDDYAKYHFDKEEHVMQTHSYNKIVDHVKLHQYFIEHIHNMKSKINAEDALYHINIVVFLYDWFMKHILLVDRKLVDYLNSKGINQIL